MSADLALFAATEAELRPVLTQMTRVLSSSGRGPAWSGELSGRACRLRVAGVGAANAAHALTLEIEAARPRAAALFGVGGAFPQSGLPVGAAAVATEEIYGDLGADSPDGWLSLERLGFPAVSGPPPLYNRFPMDMRLARRAAKASGAALAPFVTVSTCAGTEKRASELYDRFGASVENMEGAAAAHVCALYGLPLLEVRGISNIVENRDRSRWRLPEAVSAAADALLNAVSGGALDV